MKKIFLILLGLTMLGTGFVYADQIDPSGASGITQGVRGELVTLDSSTARISQLERRLASLERDMHSQNDYIRNLERDLNDLRRRR